MSERSKPEWKPVENRMPALYIGHGAPPLLDDPIWSGELAAWASTCPARRRS